VGRLPLRLRDSAGYSLDLSYSVYSAFSAYPVYSAYPAYPVPLL
jgi:hypothetical protein